MSHDYKPQFLLGPGASWCTDTSYS